MWSRFLSQQQTQLRADGSVERTGGRMARFVCGEQIRISRALCHFETMPAPAGGQSWRAIQATKLAARARTPISDPEFYLDYGDTEIGVWSWSRAQLDPLRPFEGAAIPESILYEPGEDGPRLVSAIDGVEGQVWRAGQLRSSRWWPAQPSAPEWRDFLRAARVETEDSDPPVVQTELSRTEPPRRSILLRAAQFKGLAPRDLAAAALIFLAAPFLFLGAQWLQLALTQSSLEAELSALSMETFEISNARQRAQDATNELNAYSAAMDRVHPSQLFVAILDHAETSDIDLRALEMRDAGVRVTITAPTDFAPDALVRALEAEPLLENVRLEPGRQPQEWVVSADLEQI